MNINKIAKDYITEIQGKLDSDLEHEFANFLSWLCKEYILLEKNTIRELHDCYKQNEYIASKKELHNAILIAKGSIATMHDIFGKKLFIE